MRRAGPNYDSGLSSHKLLILINYRMAKSRRNAELRYNPGTILSLAVGENIISSTNLNISCPHTTAGRFRVSSAPGRSGPRKTHMPRRGHPIMSPFSLSAPDRAEPQCRRCRSAGGVYCLRGVGIERTVGRGNAPAVPRSAVTVATGGMRTQEGSGRIERAAGVPGQVRRWMKR